jgi:hypothetical protein
MPGIRNKLKDLAMNVRNPAYAVTELSKLLLLLALGLRSMRIFGLQGEHK